MNIGNVFTIEPIIVYKQPFKLNWWKDNFTVVAAGIPSGIIIYYIHSLMGTYYCYY